MENTSLTLEGVSKSYRDVEVLTDISLSFKPGNIYALLGSNGAGKTTLANVLAGTTQMTSGRVLWDGQPVDLHSPYAARQLGICNCPQEPCMFDGLNVTENVFIGFERKRNGVLDWPLMHRQTREILEELGIGEVFDRDVEDLSLAEKYLVQFARAFIADYKVLLLDELTDSLTVEEINNVHRLLCRLKERGTIILCITHRVQEALRIADEIIVLKDGAVAITSDGTVSADVLTKEMLGEDTKCHYPKLPTKRGEVLLKVRNVSNRFVNDISFDLHRGEVLGIGGLMGSGRTCLLKAIVGLDSRHSGTVEVAGNKRNSEHPIYHDNIGFVPENRDRQGIFSNMCLSENITIKNLKSISSGALIRPSEEKTMGRDYVDRLGIKAAGIDDSMEFLSGGNKQKAVVARNVFSKCNIYIFDEPTRGVDIPGKVEIYNVINELIRRGAGVILVSSDFSELAGMCDRVLVIRKGNLVGELDHGELTQQTLFRLCKE